MKKTWILHNLNVFNFMVNFNSCFVFETHFHWIIAKLIMCFHICSLLLFMHITPTWYLHNYKKSHKLINFMIYEAKSQVKRRLSTMHSIERTLSWLFTHAKCKRHFSIFNFCIGIYSFVNNLLNNELVYSCEA